MRIRTQLPETVSAVRRARPATRAKTTAPSVGVAVSGCHPAIPGDVHAIGQQAATIAKCTSGKSAIR